MPDNGHGEVDRAGVFIGAGISNRECRQGFVVDDCAEAEAIRQRGSRSITQQQFEDLAGFADPGRR